MHKKTITLVELILAIVLLGVIILGATAIDIAAMYFFKSSDTKTQVLNEVSFILEHIQKNASLAHGWIDNRGWQIPNSSSLRIRLDGGTPENFTDDTWVRYELTGNNFRFNNGTTWETLSSRITGCSFNSASDDTAVSVNITARFKPTEPVDSKENPEVNLQTTIFFGQHSSN